MCGRYGLTEPDKVEKRFKVTRKAQLDLRPNWNAAPSQTMPIIRLADGERELIEQRWGFNMEFKGVKKPLFNTRADKAFGNFWKKQTIEHRCLIPANYFFEWQRHGKDKTPYVISLPDMELYAFAGIWREWTGDDGVKFDAFSIITTEPNAEMTPIHNRMPVILHKDEEEAWLSFDTTPDQINELMLPSEDGRLSMYVGNDRIGSVRNNDESILAPARANRER